MMAAGWLGRAVNGVLAEDRPEWKKRAALADFGGAMQIFLTGDRVGWARQHEYAGTWSFNYGTVGECGRINWDREPGPPLCRPGELTLLGRRAPAREVWGPSRRASRQQ